MAQVGAYARWLRERRQEVTPRLSQTELAKQAGVSTNYISRLEAADSTPDPIHEPSEVRIDAISRALGRYHGRSLLNEARQAIGYAEVKDEEPPPPPAPSRRVIADGPPPEEKGELARWALRLSRDTRSWLHEYLGDLERLGVSGARA